MDDAAVGDRVDLVGAWIDGSYGDVAIAVACCPIVAFRN